MMNSDFDEETHCGICSMHCTECVCVYPTSPPTPCIECEDKKKKYYAKELKFQTHGNIRNITGMRCPLGCNGNVYHIKDLYNCNFCDYTWKRIKLFQIPKNSDKTIIQMFEDIGTMAITKSDFLKHTNLDRAMLYNWIGLSMQAIITEFVDQLDYFAKESEKQ